MLTNLWSRASGLTHRPSPGRGQPRPRRLGIELLEDRCLPSADLINSWNEELLRSLAAVNTAPVPMARNMSIVHVAMFDAVNAIDRSYEPYAAEVHASRGASQEAAAAQAAHDTLVALYPSRAQIFHDKLNADLAGIPPGRAMQGVAIGAEVARQILALRANDGSRPAMPWTPPNNLPGTYQVTPPNNAPAGNLHVASMPPFAIESNSQFRADAPPALGSEEYARDFNEVKVVGASDADQAGVDRDNNGLPDRTGEQTLIAERWQAALGNHTVWNRIAQDRAAAYDLSLPETARLFALMNMALNDGLQTSYESKYHYVLWRPITAIHRADEDGNPATEAEPPIPGVPGSGWMTENPTTPPYPDYTSNASAIGAACATVLSDVIGSDVSFTVPWASGARTYANFWAAANEQADARVFGGIHFRFACEAGQEIGRDVANYVLDNVLEPRDNPSAFKPRHSAPAGDGILDGLPGVTDGNAPTGASGDAYGGAVAYGPLSVGVFGLFGGAGEGLLTPVGGAAANSQIPGRVGDSGPDAMTADVKPATHDDRASTTNGVYLAPGAAGRTALFTVTAADLTSAGQDDILDDLWHL